MSCTGSQSPLLSFSPGRSPGHCIPQTAAGSDRTQHCNLAGKMVQVMEIKPVTRCGGRGKDSDTHQHLLAPLACCSDPQGSVEGAMWDLSEEVPSPLPARTQPTASCCMSCPNRTQPHRHSSVRRVCSPPGKCTRPRPPTGAHTGPVRGFQAAHCATSSCHPHTAGLVALAECRAARHSLLFPAHSLPLSSA